MSLGFRIGKHRLGVEAALIERFRAIPCANISDAMWRLTAGGAKLRPVGPARMIGTALTVRTAPGDNLMVHKAIAMAKPGDVIVVDAGGDLTNAIIGDRMVTVAAQRGVAGFVINGAIRDRDDLAKHSIPVFAAGVTHRGPYKNGPGEINYPIAIDGMVIESGDIVVGDADGFLSIPFRDALEVCIGAEAKLAAERDNPPKSEPEKIDADLRRLGCVFE